MLEYGLYAAGFFLITLALQFFLFGVRKNHNKGKYKIWAGWECVLLICMIGLMNKNLAYYAGVIGYVIADEIGKNAGWHD